MSKLYQIQHCTSLDPSNRLAKYGVDRMKGSEDISREKDLKMILKKLIEDNIVQSHWSHSERLNIPLCTVKAGILLMASW